MTNLFADGWKPTKGLRFVNRGGRVLLQQQWKRSRSQYGSQWTEYGWHDVPLHDEKTGLEIVNATGGQS